MNKDAKLPRLTSDESPESLALLWMLEKLLYVRKLNPHDVESTYVEFYGYAPITNLGPMVSSDSALIQFIRAFASQNNSSSVFVIRPTTVEPDGKRGVFCYIEVSFGKGQQTIYKMYDGERWNEIEDDKQPLGRLLYAPGEPIPK